MKYLNVFSLIFFFLAQVHNIHASYYSGSDSNPALEVFSHKIDTGEFVVENKGLKIWYKVSGKGPVCILPSPGWGPGCELYYNSMRKMEEWFTMVYMDTRGSGRSDKPEMEQYTTSNILSDMEAVRSDLGVQEVWLMGHSKGGALVLNYAFENKDLVGGIILIDASGGIFTSPEKMQAILMEKQDEPWFASAAEYLNRQPRDEADWLNGIKAVMPMYFSTTEKFERCKDVLLETSLSFQAFQAQNNWQDCESELGSKLGDIDLPVLVVVGMQDFICGPYVASHLHRELPYSKLLPIEDAGHFPWIEQPESFFSGIQAFLREMNYIPADL